ncbi:Carboxypeptidase D [Armadillidium nasatum]|uniref:Carboxypeptidase D n=1 Tax=Armadillidium nasatum TaxID=96803 RepID=A0A5N5T8G1_9CRUS|nr:Carboxypeptidase D [Armadillidium nasatum]
MMKLITEVLCFLLVDQFYWLYVVLRTSQADLQRYHSFWELEYKLHGLSLIFPNISRLYSIGHSVNGRELYVFEISDNPGVHEPGEPEFRYVANMHGDETVGRELLLILAHYLLEGYVRQNAQNIDLNRDFPDRFRKVEISCVKYPSPNSLRGYWNLNKESLIFFMEQSHIGIKGFVKDENQNPINGARIQVHEAGKVVTTAIDGDYWRPVIPGVYQVSAMAKGYATQTKSVTVNIGEVTQVDFNLTQGIGRIVPFDESR